MIGYIEHEIDSKIDHNLVLSKFIDSLFKKSSEYNINMGYCPKKWYLGLYVKAKIELNRRIKTETIHEASILLKRNLLTAMRKAYYTVDCQCGSCNKNHNKDAYWKTSTTNA